MGYLLRLYKLFRLRKKWRLQNAHNSTSIDNLFDIERVTVGKRTYGKIHVSTFNNDKDVVLQIGHFCSIASNVHFVCGGDHYLNRALTFPVEKKLFDIDEATSKGRIVVDDDVWIGTNALILSGVHIGKGAVVAAGSVVTKDVPPFALVGGVPAKVIKYRLPDDIISRLMESDYSQLTDEKIRENIELFNTEISLDMAEKIRSLCGIEE